MFFFLAAFRQRTASGRSSTDRLRETPTSTFPWRATSTRTSPSTWSSNANPSSTSSTSSSPVCSSPSWPRLSTTCLLTVSTPDVFSHIPSAVIGRATTARKQTADANCGRQHSPPSCSFTGRPSVNGGGGRGKTPVIHRSLNSQ